MSEKLVCYITRFPDKMRNKIAALAKANGQSMNAEVKEVPLMPGRVIYGWELNFSPVAALEVREAAKEAVTVQRARNSRTFS